MFLTHPLADPPPSQAPRAAPSRASPLLVLRPPPATHTHRAAVAWGLGPRASPPARRGSGPLGGAPCPTALLSIPICIVVATHCLAGLRTGRLHSGAVCNQRRLQHLSLPALEGFFRLSKNSAWSPASICSRGLREDAFPFGLVLSCCAGLPSPAPRATCLGSRVPGRLELRRPL